MVNFLDRQSSAQTPSGRRPGRARSSTAHSYLDRYEPLQEEPSNMADQLHIIQPTNSVELPGREAFHGDNGFQRPVLNQAHTFEGPRQLRTISENYSGLRNSPQIRPVNRVSSDPYADPPEMASSYTGTSPEYTYRGRSVSPATSHGSAMSRASSTAPNGISVNKRAPPPPPPRSKKPPPPPPPMKKPMVSTGDV